MGKGTQLRYIDRQRLRLSDCVILLDVCWRLKSGLRRFSTVLHLIPVAFICLQRLIQLLGRSCGTYFVSFKVSSTGFSCASSPYQLCHRWDFGGWSRPWRAAENSSGTRKETCCLTAVLLNTTFSWMFSPYQGDNKPSYTTARFQEFNVCDNFTWKKLIGIQLYKLYPEKTCWNIVER